MSKDEPKKKLAGMWHTLHIMIWLVGIYILATRGRWWPGILVLVAISALYEAFLQRFVPDAFVMEKAPEPATPIQANVPSTSPTTPAPAPIGAAPEHRIDLLPQACPSCNGPIRAHEVRWTGPQSANCPYCGTNLPMRMAG